MQNCRRISSRSRLDATIVVDESKRVQEVEYPQHFTHVAGYSSATFCPCRVDDDYNKSDDDDENSDDDDYNKSDDDENSDDDDCNKSDDDENSDDDDCNNSDDDNDG